MSTQLSTTPLATVPVSIPEAGARLRARELTSAALVTACLAQIRERNPELHALITVDETGALAEAAQRDAELATGGMRGPLHGIPIVHKDLIDTARVRTTIGSAYYGDRVPDADAVVVQLLKRAGAICLGKTNLSEFATHPSGRNEFYGDVRNPLDGRRVAGGSSGGTAAAIAAGFCLGGTGSDTGGSIRIPASWCGIVGLRPTYGLVSLTGIHARAHSLDVCGPMARDVTSCALLLDGMVTRDQATNREEPDTPYSARLGDEIAGLRVGVIDDYTYRDVDSDVGQGIRHAADALASLHVIVENVRLPMLNDLLGLDPLMRILLYEFNQMLGPIYSREHRGAIFGQSVQENLAAGAVISAAEYAQAMSERPRHIAAFRDVFQNVDLLLTPAVPMSPPFLEEVDPQVWGRTRRYTLPFSYLGVPAISIPVNAGGMPVGLQLVADRLQERLLLGAAYHLEQALKLDRITGTTRFNHQTG